MLETLMTAAILSFVMTTLHKLMMLWMTNDINRSSIKKG
jgi:hypothetical protein